MKRESLSEVLHWKRHKSIVTEKTARAKAGSMLIENGNKLRKVG